MRNIPDVALTADDVWILYGNGKSESVSGTSCAAPLWAGFTALVNQQAAGGGNPTVGFINPAIYALGQGASYTSAFHDITTGNNTNAQSQGLYFAVSGYDLCTGWGTPNGAGLINALSPEPLQITPSAGFVSSGPFGGPFSVANQNFTLTNNAPAPLNWTLANTSLWLAASSSSGALTSGGAAAIVSVSLNAAASNLTVGAYTNTVSFTNLNDTVAQSFQFILTVSQATPLLNWSTPSAITYGTALGSNQLDATANVPGSFAYDPSTNTVLHAGTNILSVMFTPADTVDYSSATGTVSLTVTMAAPLLSWTTPSAITYGAALGSNQLDATANVPGSFDYNPSAGTVLGPGANTLSVIFIPADPVDYSGATGNVSLVVSVVPIALNVQLVGNDVVLSWNDPASVFVLQTAPAATGTFTNVPGAASPYTNAITGAQQFFQLVAPAN
jgi:hypothetical protein